MANRKKIYLTIDDSPSADFREKITFLYENDIPAVIFCIGEALEKYPEPVIDAIRKGYLIGNHSFSHPRFSNISFNRAKKEIHTTDQIIENLYARAGISRPLKLFRFPFGDKGWNKKLNIETQNLLPSSVNGRFNRLSSKRHKKKIQRFLNDLGYAHPKIANINYSFYHQLNLMNENDMYWTFDFSEYKIDSLQEIETLMNRKENWDHIQGKKYQIGSLADKRSDDIVLIHDHTETSPLFYGIIERCMKANFKFESIT